MTYNKKTIIFFIIILSLFSLIYLFLSMVVPSLLFVFILAILLNPLIEFMEKKGISRTCSSLLLIVFSSLLIFLIFWLIEPELNYQIDAFSKRMPDFKDYLERELFPKINKTTGIITGQKYKKTIHIYDLFKIDYHQIVNFFVSDIGASTKYLFSWFINIILTPLFMFFIFRDYNKIYDFLISFFPAKIRPKVIEFSHTTSKKIKDVIGGQITVIAILSILYPTALLVAGLPSAVSVGLAIAIARFVPYLDTITGIALCFFVLVTTSASNELILSTSLAFLSIQCLDGLLLTPRVMGRFTGLHPFLVIICVVCFGDWFGFYGVLLALPTAAVAKVAYKMILDSYKRSDFYQYDDGNSSPKT